MGTPLSPGTIGSPQDFSLETVYDTAITATSPTIAVYRFYGTAGKMYMIVCEISETNPSYDLNDSVCYVYKPSNTTFTDSSRDYVNDDDGGPLIAPYAYYLGYGSRVKFTADETGWFVVIVSIYGTNF